MFCDCSISVNELGFPPMAKPKLSRGQIKLKKLLQEFSQRELGRKINVTQAKISLLNSGKARNIRQSTRRKFVKVGIAVGDWDT